jgi:Rps23 Pro-64 3,4-dihydroxylase Tpa1-like proline 4-hydroxylase
MRLAYSIPNKLWWIHDFLSLDIYKGIHDAIIKERKDINLHNTKGLWDENLISHIKAPDRVVGVSSYPPFLKLATLIKHNQFLSMDNVKKITANIHYMKKDTGIQWHNDGKWKYGATYYINRRWNKNFGGEFMFSDDLGHGFLPFVGNSLVVVKSIEHKVNPVRSNVMPRITVQMFME